MLPALVPRSAGRVAPRFVDAISRGMATEGGKEGSTVESIKEAAKRTGDAAKEWLTGASQHKQSAQEQVRQTAEGAYESAKRATQDVTRSARDAASSKGFAELKGEAKGMAAGVGVGEMKEKAAQAMGAVQDKASELAGQANQAVKDAVGGERKLESARAVWEEGRPAEQKAQEQSSRKSQLTDEAHGDNPAESATRDEKKITESDFYTKA